MLGGGLSLGTVASASPIASDGSNGSGPVTITWSPVVGAASYNIYRGTSSGAETLLASGVTSPYVDNAAVSNTLYYYYITSVNAGGIESVASPETTGRQSAS